MADLDDFFDLDNEAIAEAMQIAATTILAFDNLPNVRLAKIKRHLDVIIRELWEHEERQVKP